MERCYVFLWGWYCRNVIPRLRGLIGNAWFAWFPDGVPEAFTCAVAWKWIDQFPYNCVPFPLWNHLFRKYLQSCNGYLKAYGSVGLQLHVGDVYFSCEYIADDASGSHFLSIEEYLVQGCKYNVIGTIREQTFGVILESR